MQMKEDDSRAYAPTILAVVVLYKCSLEESFMCQTLQKQAAVLDPQSTTVLLYDNSPTSAVINLPKNWIYVGNPKNGGVAAAYNRALELAHETGADWLLLLDQDSCLPPKFLVELNFALARLEGAEGISAVVPRIYCNGRQISPVRPMLGLDRPINRGNAVVSAWISAINSGAAIRVSFVEEIGGFNQGFWLDYLDHWLFRTIFARKKSVYISDAKVQHDLSVANLADGIGLPRYANVLEAERRFTNEFLPLFWKIVLMGRLAARAVKYGLGNRNKGLSRLLFSHAFRQFATLLRLGPR